MLVIFALNLQQFQRYLRRGLVHLFCIQRYQSHQGPWSRKISVYQRSSTEGQASLLPFENSSNPAKKKGTWLNRVSLMVPIFEFYFQTECGIRCVENTPSLCPLRFLDRSMIILVLHSPYIRLPFISWQALRLNRFDYRLSNRLRRDWQKLRCRTNYKVVQLSFFLSYHTCVL